MPDAPRLLVLVVDDEEAMLEVLRQRLEGWGYRVETAADAEEAARRLGELAPSIVLSDVVLPGASGVELLRRLRSSRPGLPVVLMTAHGSVDLAVEAMKAGATDFVTKPLDHRRLRAVLGEAGRRLPAGGLVQEEDRLGDMVGVSPQMREVFDAVREVAATEAAVLITGESGTGKELVARSIHRLGPRADREFVAVNAAAIPRDLMESEIFGHERGAFTGASARRAGCFELAHEGTLLLDEIAEMPPLLQPKLLRVLEDGRVRRLGGSQEHRFDVRVLSATNRDPRSAIRDGVLREDLYYRMSVLSLELPPLRRREGDVPVLARHFLDAAAARYGLDLEGLSDAALGLVEEYPWPGNVRELRNAMERAAVLAREGWAEPRNLPPAVRERQAPGGGEIRFPRGTTLAEAEKALVMQTLEQTGNNKTEAARCLGITPRTIYNKLKAWEET